MFRRKEEGADSSDVSTIPSTAAQSGSGMTGNENSQTNTTQTSQSAQGQLGVGAQSSFNQPPQMQPVVRTVTDMTRNTPATPASPAAGGYRPSPVADFNRGVSRPSAESNRTGLHPAHTAAVGAMDKSVRNPRVLTVGNDILLKGEIATCDRIIIEGRVEAKLQDVHTVEIAGSGSFKGTAEVEEAEVSGLFEGDLIVRTKLVIYSTGEVRGNITYGEIEIERGGKMTGQIKTVSANAGSAATSVTDKNNLLDVLDGKHRAGKDKEAAA